MISLKSGLVVNDRCIYNSNVTCNMNFDCSSCPIGCIVQDIEDILTNTNTTNISKNDKIIFNSKEDKNKIN